MGQGNGLAAVLVGSHLGNDLRGDVAGGGKAVGLFDHGAGNDGAVLQHVLQVHQIAVVHVLGEVVGIVEVDDARLVGFHNVLGQQNAAGDVLGHLAGHVVPLDRVDGGVLVGVFLLDFLVVAFDEAENLVVGGVGAADQIAGIAVGDVLLGHLVGPVGHDLRLHQVLDFLHTGGAVHLLAVELHPLGNALDLGGGQLLAFGGGPVGAANGLDDLGDIKDSLGTVALDDFQ